MSWGQPFGNISLAAFRAGSALSRAAGFVTMPCTCFMTVVDKKAADLVITDAGTNAVGWERFETDYFPILNLTRPTLKERTCYILGSLCTPHDVWGYSYWGDDIRPEDVLMVPTQGAYTYKPPSKLYQAGATSDNGLKGFP